MRSLVATLTLAGLASLAAAQSVAEIDLVLTNPGVGAPRPQFIEVYAESVANPIGNNSGVAGVDLRFDVFNGEVLGVVFSSELFGAPQVFIDGSGASAAGFANSFAGNNFSLGLPVLTLEVLLDQPIDNLAPTISGVAVSAGSITEVGPVSGILGPFQPFVAYDTVLYDSLGAGCSPADIAMPSGIIDLSDVNAFIDAFVIGDAIADIAEPFQTLDVSDIDAFIDGFLAGCP